MRFSTKAITTCAVLAALALALSYLESFFPPLLPLPGVKLGLANIVTVYALYALGASSALAILVVRCLLGSLFAGNASALLFSLLGGLAAMLDGHIAVKNRAGWRANPVRIRRFILTDGSELYEP